MAGLLGYIAGDYGHSGKQLRPDDELSTRLRSIERNLAGVLEFVSSVSTSEQAPTRICREGAMPGMEVFTTKLREAVKGALSEYAESAPDAMFCSGPVYAGAPDNEPALTTEQTPPIDVVLAATDAVLAQALEAGVWNDAYERAYNNALAEASDQAWAQAQSRLAGAVNSGRLTLPEDFLPGP
jgi:hypothetical protein